MDEQKISFIASLPPIQSAIQISRLDSTILKLEISQSEMASILRLSVITSLSFGAKWPDPNLQIGLVFSISVLTYYGWKDGDQYCVS